MHHVNNGRSGEDENPEPIWSSELPPKDDDTGHRIPRCPSPIHRTDVVFAKFTNSKVVRWMQIPPVATVENEIADSSYENPTLAGFVG